MTEVIGADCDGGDEDVDGNAQGSPSAAPLAKQSPKFPPAFVCSLGSIPLVLIAFFCFYGHAVGLTMTVGILAISWAAVLFYWGTLAALLIRFPRGALKLGHKGWMATSVAILFVLLICISIHFARYS
eukprot:TRINITY_DN56571_c0_g1_i1.p1 TRINITY_DN56571_c0_g1~~TRINITY_DN56571_c0_g1_i1.p1  ORF type:complete len:128 (-),score=11.90 TRINITY_DN56571_c0_g1_i1:162-545(-)